MVRVNAHQDEDEGTAGSSSPGGQGERKRGDQKVNALRSKHSETEQRRRSKINERFQVLRELIPENDQKRDKASFLLEVIHYIQFLQERLQMYEGTYQGWSPEPTKLMPWRSNSGHVESFIDQSQLARNGTDHEENYIVNSTFLSHAQTSVESDLSGEILCRPTDNPHVAENDTIPLNIPSHSNLFEGVSCQPCQGSLLDVEQLTPQSQSQFWAGKSCANEASIPIYNIPNEEEGLKSESGEASISRTYSKGLLNSLSNALQSSGVDLSRANISVQLDICRSTNSGSNSTVFSAKDHENPSGVNADFGDICDNYAQPHKRQRTDGS